MESGFEANSWHDFLATPPNMSCTPPGMFPDGLYTNLEEINSPIFDQNEINSCLNPSQLSREPIVIGGQDIQQNSQQNSTPRIQPTNPQTPNETNQIENRTLLITGANPATTEEDIMKVFNQQNGVKKVDLSKIDQGIFTVEFYDIRQAIQTKQLINGTTLLGYYIFVSFAPLPIIIDPKKPPNNGTIVIFKLPSGITDDQLSTIFSQFGEIRQIRGTPSKTQQKFIEYYDTRASEAALVSMGGKYVMGCRVSIEFSLPGGFRRGIQKVEANHSPLVQKTHY